MSLVACLVSMCWASAQVNTNRMMQIGRNALYFEDYVLSIQYFNRVINVKPYMPEPYFFRAVAKFYLDDLRGCESDCDVVLGINPFYIDAYNLRGISRLRQRKNDEARADFEQGLSYEPDNVNLLMNNGIAYINLKEYDKAIEQYDHLLKYDKKSVHALLYRGIALVERGDTTEAMDEFRKAAKINRYSPDAFTYMGMVYYQQKNYAEALKCFDRLAEIRPLDANVYVNRAITKYNMDDLRGCAADLDEAVRLDSKNIMAYQNRGILRAEAGDLNRSADDFSKVLALDPSDDIALFNRAMIYLRLGETVKALEDLNIIIAKHPEFGPAYQQRAVVKRQMGDNKGAELDYMTAMNFEHERIKRGLANGERADGEQEGEGAPSDAKQSAEGAKKKSRGKNDRDMKKYDRMVVVADFGDNDDKLGGGSEETIRGRVQDRDIAVDLEPIFELTFFAADTVLPNARYFKQSVESFNSLGLTDMKLVVSNRGEASDMATARAYKLIGETTARIEDSPSDGQLYLVRGIFEGIVLNYNAAIADFGACILKDPSDVNALLNRAAARYKMVETIRGMEAEMHPVDGDVMGGGLPANVRNEVTVLDYDLIMQDLERVVELEPGNEFAYYDMSLVCCQRKQMEKALSLLDTAIGLNGQFAEAYFNRGIIKIYLGQEAEGAADLSKSGELGMFKAYNVIKRYVRQKEE